MKIFSRYLNTFTKEHSKALMLFSYQFLVVAAITNGKIVRDTLFLTRYNVQKLPFMYICIAIFISFLTLLYTKKCTNYRLDTLIKSILTISFVITGLFIFLIKINWSLSYPLLYIFMQIMSAFTILGFWTFTTELLNSREAKKILGFIGAGGVLGSFTAGQTVRYFVKFWGLENMLFFNLFLILMCIFLVHFMGCKFKNKLSVSCVSKERYSSTASIDINVFSNKYVGNLALITLFIFIVATLIDFQFKVTAQAHFSEKELAGFLGNIYAIFGGIIPFFVQLFLTGRLLKYSVFFSLLILPSMFSVTNILFLFFPTSIFFITSAKASDFSFRYTINDAAMSLLYIPLQPAVRRRTKAMIDGIIKPLSIGFAGMLIYFLSYINVRIITLFVITLAIAWFLIILVIKKQYIKVLMDKIKKKQLGIHDIHIKEELIFSIVKESVKSKDQENILMALDMVINGKYYNMFSFFLPLIGATKSDEIKIKVLKGLRKMETKVFSKDLVKFTKDRNKEVINEAILTYGFAYREKSVKTIIPFLENDNRKIRSAAIISLMRYGGTTGIKYASPHIEKLIQSKITEEKIEGSYLLGKTCPKNMEEAVNTLLTDPDNNVRRNAIKAATKFQNQNVIQHLFKLLENKDMFNDAIRALVTFGDKVIIFSKDILENDTQSFKTKSKVINILVNIASDTSHRLLMNILLKSKEEALRNIILKGLRCLIDKTCFTPNIDTLKKILNDELFLFYQILYYKVTIEKFTHNFHLIDILKEKHFSCFSRIFSILSLMYGKDVYNTLYYNLSDENTSDEKKVNSIEAIDNILDFEIKKILIPILETKDELKLLHIGYHFFKLKKPQFEEILETFLIEKNAWIRAVTIHIISLENIKGFEKQIKRSIHDCSPIIRETALSACYSLRMENYCDELDLLKNDTSKNVSEYALYISNVLEKKG